MQWVSHNSRTLVVLDFSFSLANRRPLWTSSASFPIQVINVATQRRFVLFRRSVTSSYASQTCCYRFHSLDKINFYCEFPASMVKTIMLHIKVEATVLVDEGVGMLAPDCDVVIHIQLHLSSLWISSLLLINTPSLTIKALSSHFWHHEKYGLLVSKLNWLTSGHDQDLENKKLLIEHVNMQRCDWLY